MNKAAPRALVFDSGLGGLSVAREIRSLIPQVELFYYADNAYFPYGSRPESELLARVLEQMTTLCHDYQPDIIVLACNTASTLVLPQLRARIATPIVGVVPAVKPAALHSNSGVIGLLATPGTVLRQYTAELIRQFANHCEVISVGSDQLASIAEAKLLGEPVSTAQLQDILAPFHSHQRASELDTIVLACTHFPLLIPELQQAYGEPVHWIDSGNAVVRRVRQLLLPAFDMSDMPVMAAHHFTSSAPMVKAAELSHWLSELGFAAQHSPLAMNARDSAR